LSEQVYDLLVIGSGPAGLTAALYGSRAGLKTALIGGQAPGGKVARHHHIENYPPFGEGVGGAELMVRWIKQVGQELGAYPDPAMVREADLGSRPFTLRGDQGTYWRGRALIVATGSLPRRLGVEGEDRLDGEGVYFCATCDAPLLAAMERRRAVVVGGGDSAAHTALGVLPHAESVTLVARGPLRASPSLLERLRGESKVTFLTGQVAAIRGGKSVTGLSLQDGSELACDAVFVGVGNRPASGFLAGALDLDAEGFILTDERLMTSLPGVWAAGDARATPLRQIVTAAADGALAAAQAARWLATEGAA
jgi:thioredoxin reductase (NADPH)